MDILAPPDNRRFQVNCDAGDSGAFRVGTNSLSIRVGQRIRAENQEGMWDSVHILCEQQADGSLSVEVLAYHPDWEEARRIVKFHSCSQDTNTDKPSLVCDLGQFTANAIHRTRGAQ